MSKPNVLQEYILLLQGDESQKQARKLNLQKATSTDALMA